jgi:hypothetical protein
MKTLMVEHRTRLSVVVRLAAGAPTQQLPADEVHLSISGASGEPLVHRPGYWLFMNVPPGKQTLTWTSTHHQDGQLAIEVEPDAPSAAIVEFALTPAAPAAFALASLPRGHVGKPYRQPMALKGGKAPFRYAATGLPPGLVVRQAAGTIEGTPTARGSRQVTLTVTDINGTHDSRTFGLRVVA